MIGTVQDIDDLERQRHALEESQARLRRIAYHDTLTGLLNRASFLERLSQAIERARTHGSGLVPCFIDADNFKHVNDRRGHGTGDALMASVGARLTGLLGAQHMAACDWKGARRCEAGTCAPARSCGHCVP